MNMGWGAAMVKAARPQWVPMAWPQMAARCGAWLMAQVEWRVNEGASEMGEMGIGVREKEILWCIIGN